MEKETIILNKGSEIKIYRQVAEMFNIKELEVVNDEKKYIQILEANQNYRMNIYQSELSSYFNL